MTMISPKVAILSSMIEDCKGFSKIFKNINILIDSFDDADSFLISHIQRQYDLVLVRAQDVDYEGQSLFDRPELKKVQRAFIVASNSDLKSVAKIESLGSIFTELDLLVQVRGVLDQYNRKTSLIRQVNQLETFHDKYRHKQEALVASLESERTKTLYGKDFFEVCDIINFNKDESDFKSLIANVFEPQEFVTSVTVFDLNSNTNKLCAVKYDGMKNINVPDIWLGHIKLRGVNENGMNMVKNIVSSLVHNPVVTLAMSANGVDITTVVALEVDRDYLFNFNWQVVESLLSGVYAQIVNASTHSAAVASAQGPFELLGQISQTTHGRNLIAVDTSEISDLLELRSDFDFDWETFWRDMKINLSQITNLSNIYNISFESIVLDVENDFFEESFAAAKDLCKNIRLAKYFSGKDKSLILSMSLNVFEVPYSQYSMVTTARKLKAKRSFQESTI
ncbi:hypothetical protein [Halobacteriovorax sp. RT-1-4]|uniref:hypothetical protein n=1 Tax=unclassified Halobacteriovorax TaxID=2639665 RepID=UPI0039998DD8